MGSQNIENTVFQNAKGIMLITLQKTEELQENIENIQTS